MLLSYCLDFEANLLLNYQLSRLMVVSCMTNHAEAHDAINDATLHVRILQVQMYKFGWPAIQNNAIALKFWTLTDHVASN